MRRAVSCRAFLRPVVLPGAEGRGAGPRSRANERGVAMVWVAATMIIIAAVLVSGVQRLKAVDDMARVDFSTRGQAREVAQAGLVDAYAWFRRQQVQPVTTFAPRRNLTLIPPINETDDATQGLLRSFEMSPGLWGRYRAQKTVAAEPFADANRNGRYDDGESFTDTDGDGKRGPGKGCRDVSVSRGLAGAGTVWLLESHAQIFRRPRADLPLGQAPNTQVAETTLSAEIRRLTMVPPATAALCSSTLGGVSIGTRGRLRSTGTCIAYGTRGGSGDLTDGELLGPTSTVRIPGWVDTLDSVFGVDLSVLRGMADISTTDGVNGVPSPLPEAGLVVVTGNVTFDGDRPLRGTAVLVVKGNVTISPGSSSFFTGLLFVDGNLTVRAPALLRGTVIVRGTTDVRGTGGDYVEIEHDGASLTRLMTLMGQYRYSKGAYRPGFVAADGSSSEKKPKKAKKVK